MCQRSCFPPYFMTTRLTETRGPTQALSSRETGAPTHMVQWKSMGGLLVCVCEGRFQCPTKFCAFNPQELNTRSSFVFHHLHFFPVLQTNYPPKEKKTTNLDF